MAEETTKQETTLVKMPISVNDRGIIIKTYEDMFRFATAVQKSGLAPSSFRTPEQILIAIQMGAEIGLSPMRSLQSYCVVNGTARLWGDTPLAVVRTSGMLEYIKEWIEGEGDDMVAFCETKRKGDAESKTSQFSVQDAKTAGLWSKTGTWKTYPKRMLTYRARAFNLRDNFSDALGGNTIAEEYDGLPEAAYDPTTPKRGEREAKFAEDVKVSDAPLPAAEDTSEILQAIVDAIQKRIKEKYGIDLEKLDEKLEPNTEKLTAKILIEWADRELDIKDLLDENQKPTEINNPMTWPVEFCEKYLSVVEDYLLPIPAEVEALFKSPDEPVKEDNQGAPRQELFVSNKDTSEELPKKWLCSACGATYDNPDFTEGKRKTPKCPECRAIGTTKLNPAAQKREAGEGE